MIVRIWRGWTSAAEADQYDAHYRTEVRESLEKIQGFVNAWLLRRSVGDDEVEFISLTFFEDLDAVRAFAGPNYDVAVIAEAAHRVLTRFDPTVAHYDLTFTT